MNEKIDYNSSHVSVLLHELVDSITIFEDRKNVIVDCTLGLAGHACEVIKKMNSWDVFVGFDADIENLQLAENRIKSLGKDDVEVVLINSNYLNLKEKLEEKGITEITWIYYDLGLSSLHVDEAERGFSFRFDGPLDMRFDRTTWKTAADVVNKYRREELVNIIKEYWEEPSVNKIVSAIVDKREKWFRFSTTKELTDLIEEVSTFPKSKTRVFQALRIEVNNELKNLEISLDNAIKMLSKDGKIFVISFHSLEDRIVKQKFKLESKDCICRDLICSCGHKKSLKILTKKPIEPSSEELKINPRSRSAKARLAVKIN